MRNRAILLLAFCGTSAIAASSLNAPLLGVARDSQSQLRLVFGVAGNFVLRAGIGGQALDWEFDGLGGLVKTDAELLVLDANGAITERRPAPAGHALLGPGSAFFEETGELLSTRANRTVTVGPAVIGGKIIALGRTRGDSIDLAVCRAGRLWLLAFDITRGAVVHENAPGGAIAGEACSAARPTSLLLFDGRMLLATGQELLIETAGGTENRMPLAVAFNAQPHLRQAGAQWIEIERADPPLMIRVAGVGRQVYQLPAAGEAQ
jgi:hypothetical protein